jgi:hypothetical protein
MRTMMAGEKMVWRSEREGSEGRVREREKETGRIEKSEEEVVEESSMRLRRAMMKSMMPSWKRSTMSGEGRRQLLQARESRSATHLHR